MSDVVVWALASGVALATSAAAALLGRASARKPLASRVAELEAALVRDANGARRREAEAARRHAETEGRLRAALGLPGPTDDVAAPAGRALGEAVVERLRGLATVDACVVADETGLAWAADELGATESLAASASVVFATTLRDARPRSLHVELDDARHVVVRPLPGTLPSLALATMSTSVPTSPFALDAVVAHATLLAGGPDGASEASALSGWAYRVSHHDAPVTGALAEELEQAAGDLRCGAMALLVGDRVVAAFAADGPREDDLGAFARVLREALARVGVRMGSHARRLDWTGSSGITLSIAPLGASGRTTVVVLRREGPVDGRAFDRLGGRLRRLLPADAARQDEARP